MERSIDLIVSSEGVGLATRFRLVCWEGSPLIEDVLLMTELFCWLLCILLEVLWLLFVRLRTGVANWLEFPLKDPDESKEIKNHQDNGWSRKSIAK